MDHKSQAVHDHLLRIKKKEILTVTNYSYGVGIQLPSNNIFI